MTVKSFHNKFIAELLGIYSAEEAGAMASILMQNVLGLSRADVVMKGDENIDAGKLRFLNDVLTRLKNEEPLQYILGRTEFYGLDILLNPDVLIPRSETEELIAWVLNTVNTETPKILDFGTGSGCIPLALKKNLPKSKITGVDKSQKALKLAKKNARSLNLDVEFLAFDILRDAPSKMGTVDVVVSNPPYVRFSEREKMTSNVLKYEPHMALFVKDEDPLIFYRKIADIGKQILKESGLLFFEINEEFGNEILSLLRDKGYENTELRKDLNGKDRMVKALKP